MMVVDDCSRAFAASCFPQDCHWYARESQADWELAAARCRLVPWLRSVCCALQGPCTMSLCSTTATGHPAPSTGASRRLAGGLLDPLRDSVDAPSGASPPPHWTGPVNPTTGSPIHERPVAVEGPRERAMGSWDPAGPPLRGSSQWGTSRGWERVGQDARPVSPGAVCILFTGWHVKGLACRGCRRA